MRLTVHAATVALLPALALAQGDFNLDKSTAGTLGTNLVLRITAAPANSAVVLMPSVTGGPTPISAFDPNDPRVLAIGTELSGNWQVLFSDGAGAAQYSLPLPNDPALASLLLNWQSAVPGTVSLVGPISNPIRTQTSLAGDSVLAPAALATPRSIASAFPDPNENAGAGDVLLAGGGSGTLTGGLGLQTTEFWDFRTMTTRPGPAMSAARALATFARLPDGRVLITGGTDGAGAATATCDLYNPATNTFTATGSMLSPRVLHAAVTLADGRVMVAGGTSSVVDQTSTISNVLSSVEFWNPNTGAWTSGPALGGRRLAPALTRLPDNRVMTSGGVQVGFLFGLPISAVSTTATQLWNPATNSWSAGPAMRAGRAGHHFNQVALADGRVLFSGGIFVPDLLNAANAAATANAEYYTPATNTFTSANMATARTLHTATRMPNGEVLVCGGAQGTLSATVSIDGVEKFDPATNTWTTLPPLQVARSAHAAALLPDGTLVLLGGQGVGTTEASVETVRL